MIKNNFYNIYMIHVNKYKINKLKESPYYQILRANFQKLKNSQKNIN